MLDSIVSHLAANCSTLSQVARSDTITEQGVNSAEVVNTILGGTFNYELYPVVLDEDAAYPAACYQVAQSKRFGDENYEFIREDKFVLNIYAEDYPGLDAVVGNARTALINYQQANQAGSAEITDMMQDWQDPLKLYRCGLELTLTHMAITSQSVPAAFIHRTRAIADESAYDNAISQRVSEYFAVILICASQELQTVRDALATCIVGFQPDPQIHPIEYVDGSSIGVHSHITVWRETFKYDRYIRS